jgi:beta-glucanase (GH16 family)
VQTLAEDFDRDAALGSFGAAYPGYDGYDGGRDTSRNFGRPLAEQGLWNDATTSTVAGGVYDCRLHTQGGTPQVCALTPSPDGRWRTGARYGRYSVRFRIDPVPGYKIAWLLWPASGRWRDGEIDFPEAALDGSVTGAAHDVEGRPEHDQWYVDLHTPLTGWHTATITWVPGRITFDLDGRSVSTTDPAALPRVPMRWALQAETRLAATPPDAAASGHIRIDWLVAYRYRP